MSAYHAEGQQGSGRENFQVKQYVTQELQNQLCNDHAEYLY